MMPDPLFKNDSAKLTWAKVYCLLLHPTEYREQECKFCIVSEQVKKSIQD